MERWKIAILGSLSAWGIAAAQQPQIAAGQFTPLGNGLQVQQDGKLLQVTALTDGILRVRAASSGTLPESASWAVLPSAQEAKVSVRQEQDGFSTAALRVRFGNDLRLTVTDLAGTVLQQDAEPMRWNGTGFRVSKHKSDNEHFFGLGDKPGPLDRAGESFAMWNSDTFGWQESTDPIYKSIPFFIDVRGGRSLGVLFDNTYRTFFDFGHQFQDQYSFSAPDGPLDYYLMYGPEPAAVLADYAFLTGPTPLPPLWALGFQQSRYSYMTAVRLNEVADRLRADRIPSDVLYLDIDFQDRNRPFTVNQTTFPDFTGMVRKLRDEHFHLVTITDLHIASLPGQGDATYDSGLAGDHFVKNPDHSLYIGTVWPGPSVFPDFTRQQTRAWWGTLYTRFVEAGVAGFWNDMNEPAVFGVPSKTMPNGTLHRIDEPGFTTRTTDHLEIHNVFGMENSRATYDGLLRLKPNERPFVLTRASYAGGQRYASTWTGDNSSTWNHLRMTTPQLLNLGLSGFAMSGADVGGFAGSPSPDLLTKWIELAAFQPIDRDHAAKGTRDHEVWIDGPEQEAIRRRFIEERYRLMPYLYTTAEEMSRDGMPIVRPLFLEFPHATEDGSPFDLTAAGEFLFGPSLLVVPNPSPEEVADYEVHLPPGIWYDYWTGEQVSQQGKAGALDAEQRDAVLQRKPLMRTPKLDELPVYVRGGSVVPLAPLTQSTDEMPRGPLTLRVYLNAEGPKDASSTLCAGDLYQDDGHSFDFRRGQLMRQHFTCRAEASGAVTLLLGAPSGSFKPWWSTLRVEVFGRPAIHSAVQATASGKHPVQGQQVGPAFVVEMAASGRAQELTLQ